MALTINSLKTGTVSSISGTTFTAAGTPFAAGDVGRCIRMTSGAAAGFIRKIVSFTSTSVIEVDFDWDISPFDNYINDQTGLAFAEVEPSSPDAWDISSNFTDVYDGVNISRILAPAVGDKGSIFLHNPTNVITIAGFLYDETVTFHADLSYVKINPTACVRFGDISETGYTSNSVNIVDESRIWTPNRQWTNTTSGDAGDFHWYGGHGMMSYQGNATEFSNPLWSLYRGASAIYRFVNNTFDGEFGLRIQGDESILLNFYSTGGDDSAYRSVHPILIGLFENVRVTNAKGVIYWRVSDGNLVNVFNVSFEDIINQLVYQTDTGVNAVFNLIGFEADEVEALPNVLDVNSDDPDGTLFLKNPLNTSFIDTALALITDSSKRVIWDEADVVVNNQTKTTGIFDQYNITWWETATTPTGFQGIVDGTTHTPYFQAIASYLYNGVTLPVTGRSPSSEKLTGILNSAITELNSAVVASYIAVLNGEQLIDRAKLWEFDNLHLAYPTKGGNLITGVSTMITYSPATLILDEDAASVIDVNTGTDEITIKTMPPIEITRIGATSVTSAGQVDEVTVAFPPGIQDDDVAYIFVGHSQSGENAWNTPSGWVIPTGLTEVQTGGSPASVPGVSVFRRVLSADSGSVTITNVGTNTSGVLAQMVVYRGVDTTTPEDVVSVTAVGATGDPDPGAITPVTDDCVILTVGFMDDGDQLAAAAPTNYTKILGTTTVHGPGTGE